MPIGTAAAALIGSGLSAGTGLLNSLFQKRIAKQNTDQTIAENKKLAEYQYSKNLENWNMQNAYNTPEEQMKRFEKAGLNPNLIYDKGTSGISSAIAPYQAPTVQKNYKPLELPETISFWQNFAMKQAQTDNLRAQKEVMDKDIALKTLLRINNENEFRFNWGYPSMVHPSQAGLLKDSKYSDKWNTELYKTQMQTKGEQQRQELNQYQLDLFKNGGKYFTPLLQLLQLIKR